MSKQRYRAAETLKMKIRLSYREELSLAPWRLGGYQ
jgi:hypothetical protein